MISEKTNVITEFVKEKNILHWMWDIDAIAKAGHWASEELGIPLMEVLRVMMDLSSEVYHTDDPEILAMKPDSVKEAERIIEDMETNPNSPHRQDYACPCDEPPKKKRNWRFWRR